VFRLPASNCVCWQCSPIMAQPSWPLAAVQPHMYSVQNTKKVTNRTSARNHEDLVHRRLLQAACQQ
jgi:hypothetical protein